MKTKTRTTNVSTGDQLRRAAFIDDGSSWAGYVLFGTASADQTFESLNETITYELPGHKTFGNCLHEKAVFELLPGGSSRRTLETVGASAGHLYDTVTSENWLASFYHLTLRTLHPPTIREDKWQAWSSEAVESMLPTFSEGGESMVNFVLELKSLKGLIDIWSTKRSFLKNVSGGHLNISFGWKPFISDTQRIYGALQNFFKKLRRLQENSGKPNKAHYKRYLDTVSLPSEGTVSGPDVNGLWRHKATWVQPPVYHATLNFVFNLPDMSLVSNQLKGFLDSLGVQLDASIVWNAIPYSFVVDWFFNVSDWISSLKADHLKIPATVTGFCHSVKYEYRSSYLFRPSVSFKADYNEREIARRTVLHYERRVDIPSTGLLDLTVKTPNWSQVALGHSLIAQRS